MFELEVGIIPARHAVRLTCRNKLCCNPRHLLAVPLKEALKVRKMPPRPQLHGERNNRTKIPTEWVLFIRAEEAKPPEERTTSKVAIARQLGVTPTAVWQIAKGRARKYG
jgi:hypothetical protein